MLEALDVPPPALKQQNVAMHHRFVVNTNRLKSTSFGVTPH
jgi:hypothetical protein